MHKTADARDWVALSKLAHKLKSTVDSMGIVSLQQDVRKIEADGKQGNDVDHLPELVKKIEATMAVVMAQVKKDHAL
jgi:HPt (histidine-containing phosphotransfer) domain-containing protein